MAADDRAVPPGRDRGRDPGDLRAHDDSQLRLCERSSIQAILSIASIYMLLAIGETMVVITRNVDLSVGSTLGLSAFTVGELFTHNPHTSIVLGFVVGIGIGAALRPDHRDHHHPDQGSQPRGDARGALHHPRLRQHHRNRRTGRAGRLSARHGVARLLNVIGIPWLFVIVAVIALVVAFWMYASSRSRAVCDRFKSAGRFAGWHPHDPARLHGVS